MQLPLAAVLAAAAVDTAGSALAIALLMAGGRGGMAGVALLFLCACIGVLTHAALLPGLVWASRPVALGRLTVRLGVAALGMVLAVVASFAVAAALLAAPDELLPEGQDLTPALAAFVVVPGAAAGLAATLAQRVDARPGTLRVQTWMHVAGGVLGSCLLVGSAWVFWGLALVSLAVAGLPHTLLCVRAAARAGHVWPPNAVLWRRTAWCCGTLGTAAGAFAALSL